MIKIIISLSILLCPMSMAVAQESVDSVLSRIERNNTTLNALRKAAEAERASNHAELALENPEVELGYHWGTPAAIGSRQTLSVGQSLDIATISGSRRRLAKSQDVLVKWQYRTERQSVMLTARQLCVDAIYYNALLAKFSQRERIATEMLRAGERRLQSGDGTQIDVNALRLALADVQAERLRAEGERSAVISQLVEMSGGEDVLITDTVFPLISLPTTFDEWYEEAAGSSPLLAYTRQNIDVSEQRLSVVRQEQLPRLKMGFVGEYVKGQNYQGVSVGVSLPLWGTRQRVRQAKAEVEAASARHDDAVRSFVATVRALYLRQDALRQTASVYAKALQEADNIPLLRKALNVGHISVQEYLTGAANRYEAETLYLNAMRDWHSAYAELISVSL